MYCTFLFHKSVMYEVFSFGRFSPLPDELIFEQLRGVNDRMFYRSNGYIIENS